MKNCQGYKYNIECVHLAMDLQFDCHVDLKRYGARFNCAQDISI